jgi:hypothetical protein
LVLVVLQKLALVLVSSVIPEITLWLLEILLLAVGMALALAVIRGAMAVLAAVEIVLVLVVFLHFYKVTLVVPETKLVEAVLAVLESHLALVAPAHISLLRVQQFS